MYAQLRVDGFQAIFSRLKLEANEASTVIVIVSTGVRGREEKMGGKRC